MLDCDQIDKMVACHKSASRQELLQEGNCMPVVWLYCRDNTTKAVMLEVPESAEDRDKMYRMVRLMACAEGAVAFVQRSEVWMGKYDENGLICTDPNKQEALHIAVAAFDTTGSLITQSYHALISRTKLGRVRSVGEWQEGKLESRLVNLLPPIDYPEERRLALRAELEKYSVPPDQRPAETMH